MANRDLPPLPANPSTAQKREYRALYDEWQDAIREAVRYEYGPAAERFSEAEKVAYASLCDWIRENTLSTAGEQL